MYIIYYEFPFWNLHIFPQFSPTRNILPEKWYMLIKILFHDLCVFYYPVLGWEIRMTMIIKEKLWKWSHVSRIYLKLFKKNGVSHYMYMYLRLWVQIYVIDKVMKYFMTVFTQGKVMWHFMTMFTLDKVSNVTFYDNVHSRQSNVTFYNNVHWQSNVTFYDNVHYIYIQNDIMSDITWQWQDINNVIDIE